MVPSNRWFPTNLQDRAAWYQNFASHFTAVAVSLGFVTADSDSVQADADMVDFLAATSVLIESYRDAAREYRIFITEGSIGEPAPAFPAGLSPTPPAAVATGIFERLDNLVKRIRVSPAYTPEIGGLLGIIPTGSGGDSFAPDETKPTLKATAMPGNVFQVKFVRGDSDGVQIETKIDNAADWTAAGKFFKSPAELNIPNGTGLPHSVQIRARYVDGNTPIGQNSDVITIATIP